MSSKGYKISINQCVLKMDSLKRAYKSVKDYNAQSGNDKKCNYYEKLDKISRNKPWIKQISTAGSHMPLGNMDGNQKLESTYKKSKNTINAYRIKFLEESLTIKKLKREDT